MQTQVKPIHIIGACLVVLFGFILNNEVDARSLAREDRTAALEDKRQEQSALRKRAFRLRSNDDEGDRKYELAVRAVLAYAQYELEQDKRDDSFGSGGYGSGSYGSGSSGSVSYGSGDSGSSSYGSGSYGSGGSGSSSYGSGSSGSVSYGSGGSGSSSYGSGSYGPVTYGSGSYGSGSYGSGVYGSGSGLSGRSENGAADELDDDESDALAELVSRTFKQQHANKRHWWNK